MLSNLFPVLLGGLVAQSHMSTIFIWIAIALTSTLNSHSGFHFPFFPSNEYHDYHHLMFTCNYGIGLFLDKLLLTDSKFQNSVYKDRNKVLFSFKSAKELYPDLKKLKKNKVN